MLLFADANVNICELPSDVSCVKRLLKVSVVFVFLYNYLYVLKDCFSASPFYLDDLLVLKLHQF